jgi:hypothetical protein
MKNLFEAATADEVKTRLGKLRPESERLWGKMTAPQMLAHCAISMRWAVGELVPDPAPLPVRMIGKMIKPFVFRNDDPIRKNAPSAKSLVISDERDLEREREQLAGLIDKFAVCGAAGCTRQKHPFFGKLEPGEWAILTYKHLDHHLRQFGV